MAKRAPKTTWSQVALKWKRHQLDVEPIDRIFVNRNLRMGSIGVIGFDMDHTLAIYESEPFEVLAFTKAQEKLVSKWGYPGGVLGFRYNRDFVIRGLVVDKRLGNVLKMDEHRYVTIAYHGTGRLSTAVRKKTYANRRIRLSSRTYSVIDTLFSLPEIDLYAQMVDFLEALGEKRIDYKELYERVRGCMDEAHADGSIKKVIMENPERFLKADPDLPQTLQRLRAQGKKLFLLTNSEAAFTDGMMARLLSGHVRELPHWTDYFDAVVVEAGKPGFFVNKADTAMKPRALDDLPDRSRGKVMAGGSVHDLEEMLGFKGDQVLYFGDHTYGDILKSKHASGWRTAMIIQDLQREILTMASTAGLRKRLLLMNRQRDRLVGWRDFLVRSREGQLGRKLADALLGRLAATRGTGPRGFSENLADLEKAISDLDRRIEGVEARMRDAFNPNWGPIFKAGRENSHFGAQVRSFACIYSARVSNFLNYPVDKYFLAPHEFMPHEL